MAVNWLVIFSLIVSEISSLSPVILALKEANLYCRGTAKNPVWDIKNGQVIYSKWLDSFMTFCGIHRSCNFHAVNFLWLQPVHVQHFQMLDLLKAFQNVDNFQCIHSQVWSVGKKILFGILLIKSHPKSSNTFCR